MHDHADKHDRQLAPGDASTEPSLEWRIHPAKRRPFVTVIVTLFILAVSFLVLVITESKLFSFFSLLVLFGSLAKFFFPTAYRLDPRGVTIRTSTQTLVKDWSLYRSCYPDKNGILLSPFPEPSRLENFRGIYLIFGENRDDVVAFVKSRIKPASGTPDTKETPA